MDFNIKNHIQKLKDKLPEQSEKKMCIDVISKYTNLRISTDDVDIRTGVLYLKNINPAMRTFLKTHKLKIIAELDQKKIYLRDII